ncbi:MAG TPA: oligosaccharide flippase family protein, partial [Candidatus Peribacteria bacterium]|nr:oligosaccharide flippase family protein [Candidatus Peribacteria bacterium]
MQRISFAWLSPTLTKIGRRFGIDAHYFAKSSAFVILGQVMNILKGIVSGYLISRLFPAEMYGEYRFVLSVVGTLGVLTLSGMPRAIAREVAQRKNDAELWWTFRTYSLICLVGTIAIAGVLVLLPFWGRMNLWAMFLLAAVFFIPTNVGTAFFGGIVIGRGQFDTSLRANALGGVLVIVSTLLMLWLRPSPLLLLAFTAGIPPIIYLWELRKLMRNYPSQKPSKEMFQYALKITVADIPMTLSWYLDGLLISAFFGLKELAVFSVALMIPEEAKGFLKDFLPISFSRQAAGPDTPARRKHLVHAVGWMTLVFVVGISLYIAISPFVIPWLFPLYDPAQLVPLTNWAAVMLITFPSSLFSQQLEARGNARDVLIGQWLSAAVFVVCLLTMIPSGLVSSHSSIA